LTIPTTRLPVGEAEGELLALLDMGDQDFMWAPVMDGRAAFTDRDVTVDDLF
jgi:hypothetical protein